MIYSNENRGIIQNRERSRQIIDFSSIRYDNITPTDSDGEIEYHDKAWVFIEIKYRDTGLPYGQRLAFERKVNDLCKANKQVICIVAEHYVDNPLEDIDAQKCIVREIYYNNKWHQYKDKNVFLDDLVQRFLNYVDTLNFER